MSQHFLLSSAARGLSLRAVARLSDEEAFETFKSIRWSDNGGEPYCPKCGCVATYTLKGYKLWECKGCRAHFSVTSGTIFASRKLAIRDILLAIAIFVNGAKGHSALQLSRDLDVQYKTAFVLSHKIREVMGDQVHEAGKATGVVEIDGAYFGGYVKPANRKENRIDRRFAENQTGKRKAVVIMRERFGRTLPFVYNSEAEGVPAVRANVVHGSEIHADEAPHWNKLMALLPMKRINHQQAYSAEGACTNMAESFFSRLRRAEIGTHHHISGYLSAYANEMAWRENNRRVSNGEQYIAVVTGALSHAPSAQWKGYWQRRLAA